jgi:hypothetical protein
MDAMLARATDFAKIYVNFATVKRSWVRKKYVRRGEGKNLRVQALVNSALMEIDDQLRLKMLEARRLEIEIRSAMSTVNVLNQSDKKPCKDVNGLNRFMCLMKKKISHLLFSFRYLFPVILFAYFFFFHSSLSIWEGICLSSSFGLRWKPWEDCPAPQDHAFGL